MKALSLTQPWATAITLGIKTMETRSWCTNYRGPLAIHASKAFPGWAKDFAETEHTLGRLPARLPLGAIVAMADLIDVLWTGEVVHDITAVERLYGDYSPGRCAWKLENVRALTTPVSCRGYQGLWTPPPSIVAAVEAQLKYAS